VISRVTGSRSSRASLQFAPIANNGAWIGIGGSL
jgi:hypothetical protein